MCLHSALEFPPLGLGSCGIRWLGCPAVLLPALFWGVSCMTHHHPTQLPEIQFMERFCQPHKVCPVSLPLSHPSKGFCFSLLMLESKLSPKQLSPGLPFVYGQCPSSSPEWKVAPDHLCLLSDCKHLPLLFVSLSWHCLWAPRIQGLCLMFCYIPKVGHKFSTNICWMNESKKKIK